VKRSALLGIATKGDLKAGTASQWRLIAARRETRTLSSRGYQSIVASPDGQTLYDRRGNAGFAKRRPGDVLPGLIAALMPFGRGRTEREFREPRGSTFTVWIAELDLAGDGICRAYRRRSCRRGAWPGGNP